MDSIALTRLLAWLSPVFPTGGFAYSSGLETAVSNGLVTDETTLHDWLASLLHHGRLRNDAIFLAEAHHSWNEPDELTGINDLALASTGGDELYLETTAQGRAFAEALQGWPLSPDLKLPTPCALPVVVGAACGACSIDKKQSTLAFLHAFITNQLQIAIRLSVMGQTGASRLLAGLEGDIIEITNEIEGTSLEDLGSATIMADIMVMRHETKNGRLFRS